MTLSLYTGLEWSSGGRGELGEAAGRERGREGGREGGRKGGRKEGRARECK